MKPSTLIKIIAGILMLWYGGAFICAAWPAVAIRFRFLESMMYGIGMTEPMIIFSFISAYFKIAIMQPLFTAYLAICLVAAFCLFKKKIWAQRFFFIQQLLRVVVGIDLLIGTIRMQRSTTYESSQYFWEQIGFGILFYAVLFLPSVLICWTLIKRTVRNEFNIKQTL